jgi:hypothetical protein
MGANQAVSSGSFRLYTSHSDYYRSAFVTFSTRFTRSETAVT